MNNKQKQRVYADIRVVHEFLDYGKCLLVRGNNSFDTCLKQLPNIQERLNSLLQIHVTRSFTFQDVEDAELAISKYDFDTIIAVGGGSVMDFAKIIVPKNSTLVLIPTTIGTGAENTSFAVCYDLEGAKHSVSTKLSDVVIYEQSFFESLTKEQKINGLFDMFAQTLESAWTKNSNTRLDTCAHRIRSLQYILSNYHKWLSRNAHYMTSTMNTLSANSGTLINSSKTSIAHAFSYAFTQEFGVKHGSAVMLTLPFFNRLAKKKKLLYVNDSKLRKLSALYLDVKLEYMSYSTFVEKIYNRVNKERLSTSLITLEDFRPQDMYEYLKKYMK